MEELTPGQRLAKAIKESGRSKRQIALALGLKAPSITNAIRRDVVSAKLAQGVAEQTGYRWEWLLTGDGEPTQEEFLPTIRPVSQSVRRIPVISLSHAATWPRGVREGDSMGDIEVDRELAEGLGSSSFCIVIEDDSMRDISPESVRRGDKVVIDPAVTPRPGDLVVAHCDSPSGTIFRKYRARGTDAEGHPIVELLPLNSDYASVEMSLTGRNRIIGVMVEHRRARRTINA